MPGEVVRVNKLLLPSMMTHNNHNEHCFKSKLAIGKNVYKQIKVYSFCLDKMLVYTIINNNSY